jgi:hypothetical protein
MKATHFLTTVCLLFGSGAGWAICPSYLSTEELIACINAEGAGCSYTEYIAMQQVDTESTQVVDANKATETGAPKDTLPEMQTDITDSQ